KDDLVPRPTAQCQQGQVKCGGPVGDGDGVRSAAKSSELALELLHPRPHAPPARADGLEHGISELIVDANVRERNVPAQLAGRRHVVGAVLGEPTPTRSSSCRARLANVCSSRTRSRALRPSSAAASGSARSAWYASTASSASDTTSSSRPGSNQRSIPSYGFETIAAPAAA